MKMKQILIVVSAAIMLTISMNWVSAQIHPPIPPELRGDPAKGEELFRFRGCTTCHGVDGKGGRMGPDLTKPWPRRDFAWLQTYLSNPRLYFPASIKPPTMISSREMEDLVAYLLRLKGRR